MRSLLQSGSLLTPPVGIAGGGPGNTATLVGGTGGAQRTQNIPATTEIVLLDPSPSSFNAVLPSAVGFVQKYYLLCVSTGTNTITVQTSGGQSIDIPGLPIGSSVVLGALASRAQFSALEAVSDGRDWRVLSAIINPIATLPYGPIAARGNPGVDGSLFMSSDLNAINTLAQSQRNPNGIGQLWKTLAAAPQQPTPINLPVVTQVGAGVSSVLSCTTGLWQGPTPITYTYQWLRKEVPISGETSASHTVVSDDVGFAITCMVTATNSSGATAAESNAIAISGSGTNTVAQPVALSASTITFANLTTPPSVAFLTAPLTQGQTYGNGTSGHARLPATVTAGGGIPSGTTLLIVWGGYAQSFVTSALAAHGDTDIPVVPKAANYSYPQLTGTTATLLASADQLPYVSFPTVAPAQVTDHPAIRFIMHSWAYTYSVWPWLINDNGGSPASLWQSAVSAVPLGGGLPRLEPGQRNASGSTSWGQLNMSVDGVPTGKMRCALQLLSQSDDSSIPTSGKVALWAWMA